MNPDIVNSKCKRRSGNRLIDETSDKTSRCVKINNDNEANCEQSENITVSSIFPYVEKGLGVACHNINRLINKLDELKLILDTDKSPLDIYCICETFLTPTIDDNCLKINGYSFFRKDRLHKRGGGILMYIRNGLNFQRRQDLEEKSIEMNCVETKCSNKSILLSTIYRPPDNDGDSVQNRIFHIESSL